MAQELDQIPQGAIVVLPPHGFVYLQRVAADDLDVVNAARVSLAKQSGWIWALNGEIFTSYDDAFEYGVQQKVDTDGIAGPQLLSDDEGVLRFLMRERHGTPFEQTFFKWHVRAPISVFREWHRHRIGWSYNEESGRYSQLQPDFYIPQGDALRSQIGKPGRYTFEPLSSDTQVRVVKRIDGAYELAYDAYRQMLAWGVAKEVARQVLPVGIYSQMIASCNARSLMHFLSLRNAPTAMYEIRVYAAAMEEILKEHMPITADAFVQNGRKAP